MDALLATLKSLPAIAAQPLAVVAYIAVIGAWLLAYLRTARFNSLMKRIEKFPEDERKKVVALEMNTVIPDSITAEDWLRGKRQLFLLIGYGITVAAVVTLIALAYVNRGGLEVDSVRAKTSWLFGIEAAYGEALNAPIQSFRKRDDSTKHDFRFELVMRNSSAKPINVTDVVVTFDPDETGALSSVLEISNTYVVMINDDGSGVVTSKAGQEQAQAWYPTDDGNALVVKTPLEQTLAPLTTDRFVVEVHFPETFKFRGPMKAALLTLTWNGAQKTASRIALEP